MRQNPGVQRIGLFGGSFNPIHFGHLIPAQAAAEQLGLDKLVFIPSAQPPHKPAKPGLGSPNAIGRAWGPLAPAENRLEMVRRAVEGHPLFEASDIELARSGLSFTIDTVAEFRRRLGLDVLLHWLIGADSLAELPAWHRAGELVDACRVVTLVRPGWPIDAALDRLRGRLSDEQVARLAGGVLASPAIEISATQIRHRLAAGKSVRYLLPGVVIHYIEQQRLYGFAGP